MREPKIFAASAPAKVNLHLGVDNKTHGGYHDLVTVFQAVDRREIVRLVVEPDAERTRTESVVSSIHTRWLFDGELPEDIDTHHNLAWKAVDAAVGSFRSDCDHTAGVTHPALPKVRIEVDKSVFIAGGMAGGSADAAAALLAANHYIEHYFGEPVGIDYKTSFLAAGLGSDVPFAVQGGNATGRGRGDHLRPIPSDLQFWWVFVNPDTTLSTAACFAKLDQLRADDPKLTPNLDPSKVTDALLLGSAEALAAALHNDMELPARLLRPQIGEVLDFGNEHALRAIVSGSGPTVAMLCKDEAHAVRVRNRVCEVFPEYQSFTSNGPARGAFMLCK
ncbi:4-(cytidine 5'-diphospho)-2-C-methyl-D-erythritol kinase [Corynebacterium riegelii]|uniref:GHMP family kinase ATP-binding protein n=1 Tax=Corynebacterium riegelii TaxID=156976 RepID=UPI00254FC93E|nr:4-(cytidine 5'-diphospho)-2-C-methyl-D-erythritol kinase [Corynebacterium riegelii]MDK7180723.1 4-(cytidine 5'-diphospho)-2-C-methyl-D-erythritol kinase [Corynebacterium riegelii]